MKGRDWISWPVLIVVSTSYRLAIDELSSEIQKLFIMSTSKGIAECNSTDIHGRMHLDFAT
jgi:hypothetical protein